MIFNDEYKGVDGPSFVLGNLGGITLQMFKIFLNLTFALLLCIFFQKYKITKYEHSTPAF